MRIVDPLRRPDVAGTHRGVVPPFLPTLGLALAAALLSLVCREPAKAPAEPVARPPAMTAAPGLAAFNPAHALVADLDPVPASEAFARLTPLVPLAPEAAATPARPARVAASGRGERRRAAASRLATTQPKTLPADSLASGAPEPEGVARFLPAGALPFASTADAVWDAARSLGSGAATLGGSVGSSVGSSVTTLVSGLR